MFLFIASCLLVLLALYGYINTPSSHRAFFFRTLSKRDRQAYLQLVRACGNNSKLADKMIAHEKLTTEHLSDYHATMAALGRVQNYRRHGRSGPASTVAVQRSRSGFDELVKVCRGDVNQAFRLVSFERQKNAGISHEQAVSMAIERLAREKAR